MDLLRIMCAIVSAKTRRLFSFLLLALSCAAAGAIPKPDYDYYLTGNAGDVMLRAPRTPSLVLMGGGPDVDDAFRWMIAKAGGGDVVVIRSRGADGYNPYIYQMGGVDSVQTLVIPSRTAASDPFVIDTIRKAEVLFIAGGDQSDYASFWKGTPVEDAIHELAQRNVPVGGTSAGLAIMGQYAFTALNGSVTSAQALDNPYDRKITLDRDFLSLPYLSLALADAHLDTRDRMGRLVTFLARIVQDGWTSTARGIGLAVETAVVIDDGRAFKLGVGAAYFLSTNGLPQVCTAKSPLTYSSVSVQRLGAAGSFDMVAWRSYDQGTTNYSLSADRGVLISTQPGGSVY